MQWLDVLNRIAGGEDEHTEFNRGLGDLSARRLCLPVADRRDDQDRKRWLEWVIRVVEGHKLDVCSFALLDNHYHLFLETPHAGLSRAMQALNGSYTSYFNRA